MKEPLPDSTVLLAIVFTIIVIFSLIFTVRPNQNRDYPSMEWKDTSSINVDSYLQTKDY